MKTIIRTLIVSILILNSVLTPLISNVSEAAVTSWQKGASIYPTWDGDFGTESMKQTLRNLRATHANSVSLIIPYLTTDRWSTHMYPAWNTPTDESLASAIVYARSIGLNVVIKPHLETEYGEWRANINPGDRDGWFRNYTAMLLRYARIAEQYGASDFNLGTELIGMSSPHMNSSNTARWNTMISEVRKVYNGKLTYSANWDGELDRIEFWPALDYIGVSAYFEFWGAQDNNVETLKRDWDYWRNRIIQPMAERWGKDVVFTEIGYRSIPESYKQPWNWERGGWYDPTTQANAYEALFSYWNDYAWMKGVHLWRWDSNPNAGGEGDTDYMPQRKPAEEVMRRWFVGGTVPNPNPTPNPNPNPGPVSVIEVHNIVATPSNPAPGGGVILSASVKNNGGTLHNGIVDFEIYNTKGEKVFQRFTEAQTIQSGDTKNYKASWSTHNEGLYAFKIGVFNSTWTHNYMWVDNAATISVGNVSMPNPPSTPTPVPTTFTTNIWWPSNGSSVSGIQPFKAMIPELNISQYSMYWQVDGDRLNEMYDSSEDYPHKEVLVDVGGWKWKNNGPYSINFVSKDHAGKILSEKAVNITTH